jgi:triacylglycerol lipase
MNAPLAAPSGGGYPVGMSGGLERDAPSVGPLWGELRYSGELARALTRHGVGSGSAPGGAPPVLLIPGFMAGDGSLRVLAAWLRRRGHRVSMSGMRANVDCAERALGPLHSRLSELHARSGQRVYLIGQSRGGGLARCLAARAPQSTAGLAMLGTPVLDPLAICRPVRHLVGAMALLGDLGVPGVFSTKCIDGACCQNVREELRAPLASHVRALSVYSKSDGVVDWRACLDPHAQAFEVDSSHCGMSVHADVFEVLARALDAAHPGYTNRAAA